MMLSPHGRPPAGRNPTSALSLQGRRSEELAMSTTVNRRRLALAILPFLAMAPSGPTFAAKGCAAPADWFLNPFTARSAHHRPIGTGARYAAKSHPATRDWLKATSFAINGGRPGSMAVAKADGMDPIGTVRPLTGCGPVSGLPLTVRLPRAGVPLPGGGIGSCPDQPAVIYDATTGQAHQFGQFRWGEELPSARIHRAWNIAGLGHGIHPGQRLGLSASGVAGLFGLLRSHEIDTSGRPIEHALQMILPRRAGCKVMLSTAVVLPAVGRDAVIPPGSNTGHIPYGALLALPRGTDLAALRLSEPGRRLAAAIRDYGIYAVDGGGCEQGVLRGDSTIRAATMDRLRADIPKLYPLIRMVLNNDVLASPIAGGGRPVAPNCALDAL